MDAEWRADRPGCGMRASLGPCGEGFCGLATGCLAEKHRKAKVWVGPAHQITEPGIVWASWIEIPSSVHVTFQPGRTWICIRSVYIYIYITVFIGYSLSVSRISPFPTFFVATNNIESTSNDIRHGRFTWAGFSVSATVSHRPVVCFRWQRKAVFQESM